MRNDMRLRNPQSCLHVPIEQPLSDSASALGYDLQLCPPRTSKRQARVTWIRRLAYSSLSFKVQ